MSGCQIAKYRSRLERQARICAAGISKRLETTEPTVGDGHASTVLVETAKIMQPAGNHECQDLGISTGGQNIPQRRQDKLCNLGAAIGTDAGNLVTHGIVGKPPYNALRVIVQI